MGNWPRHNVETFPVEGDWSIAVYERDDRLGKGVCMSVHHGDAEIMRFDLFDPAHEHWAVLDSPRMYYPKRMTRRQYIEIAVNNLRHVDLPARLRGLTAPSREAIRAVQRPVKRALVMRT